MKNATPRTCTRCGTGIDHLGYRHKFCVACAGTSERITTTRTRDCTRCGSAYTYMVARGTDRKYCGPECARQAREAAQATRSSRFPSCQIGGCARRARSSIATMCETHYYRVRRNGDALTLKGPEPTGRCLACDNPTPRRQRLYCSALCVTRFRAGHHLASRQCLLCEAEIPASEVFTRRYCSMDCRSLAARVRAFGLTPTEYRDLLAKQGGRCAICCADARLVLDHDHETGHIRGLLCGTCNSGIGMLQDSPDVLEQAASYVRLARQHASEQASA